VQRYAVIGHPVAHSRSPDIHAAFARSLGQSIDYERIEAPLDGFAATVETFRHEGGAGANVTVPFKEEAFRLASERSPRAQSAGAANLLVLEGGRTFADNTDGTGLVRDIRDNLGFALKGQRVLILGAGGAARGVIAPLLGENPACLHIANRTEARARDVAAHFKGMEALSFEALLGRRYDLVINATSASLSGQALSTGAIYAPEALAYDMVYAARPTPFMREAGAQGARTADGLGMLVEQAAESYYVWRGIMPATAPVIDQVRSELQKAA
jgi:shikimate dehydrogenase